MLKAHFQNLVYFSFCTFMLSNSLPAQQPSTIEKAEPQVKVPTEEREAQTEETLDSKEQREQPQKETGPDRVLKPFLWKIEAETPSYLFGTIHVSDERVLKMHPVAKDLFEKSDTLFLEVTRKDMFAQMKALSLPDGQKLKDLLDKETLDRIEKQLALIDKRLSGAQRPDFHVWAWPLVLPSLKEQFENPDKKMLDMALEELATKAEKQVEGLENPATQLSGFNELSQKEQIAFLHSALTDMENEEEEDEKPSSEDVLTNLYLSGDSEKISGYLKQELADSELPKELNAKILDAILYSRNERIAEKIQETLKSHPKKMHFFAAGTAHFTGEKSVQAFLQQAGLKISRVEVESTEKK